MMRGLVKDKKNKKWWSHR